MGLMGLIVVGLAGYIVLTALMLCVYSALSSQPVTPTDTKSGTPISTDPTLSAQRPFFMNTWKIKTILPMKHADGHTGYLLLQRGPTKLHLGDPWCYNLNDPIKQYDTEEALTAAGWSVLLEDAPWVTAGFRAAYTSKT